jgi:hypothetical protein
VIHLFQGVVQLSENLTHFHGITDLDVDFGYLSAGVKSERCTTLGDECPHPADGYDQISALCYRYLHLWITYVSGSQKDIGIINVVACCKKYDERGKPEYFAVIAYKKCDVCMLIEDNLSVH